MNLVSCCVQLFDIIKDLIRVPHHAQSQERLSLCINNISRSSEMLGGVFSQPCFQGCLHHPKSAATGSTDATNSSSQKTQPHPHHHHHHHHSKKAGRQHIVNQEKLTETENSNQIPLCLCVVSLTKTYYIIWEPSLAVSQFHIFYLLDISPH